MWDEDIDDDPERLIPWCALCDMRAVYRHGDLCDLCSDDQDGAA